MKLHPKAHCADPTKTIKNCYQWEDVSLFGMTAHPDAGCSAGKHALTGCAQGITAIFEDQRLTTLTYAVEGSNKSGAVRKLKEKYGQPAIDTPDGTIWMSGTTTLSVVVGKATEGSEGPVLVTFMISRA